ncbi:DUF6308 family protein [Actinoplanes sp. TRM 88003]|uniref:DUF6308 family protein n=1 Tax=Paractinoplanes aksuensis TaxID=2939490 RepID=A0ABT1DSG2_9ACTN|nr:DUF6308 family protein [Actinoplanes aksuensis]MCO8273773.1 DUF6308 family protein [Actinoplanes aksuensis]
MPGPSLDLLDLVRNDGERYLGAYFSAFTGRWFETLAGGGDRPDVRNRITADDLIAVQMLDVKVPPAACYELLEGQTSAGFGEILARIPVDVEMGTPGAEALVQPESDAAKAWQVLDDLAGIDYVIAGKIMARKRPTLLPVYDSWVYCLFGYPQPPVWPKFQKRLAADGGALRAALADVRAAAEVVEQTSILRALDVVLWMQHRALSPRCSRTKTCPAWGTVALTPS